MHGRLCARLFLHVGWRVPWRECRVQCVPGRYLVWRHCGLVLALQCWRVRHRELHDCRVRWLVFARHLLHVGRHVSWHLVCSTRPNIRVHYLPGRHLVWWRRWLVYPLCGWHVRHGRLHCVHSVPRGHLLYKWNWGERVLHKL